MDLSQLTDENVAANGAYVTRGAPGFEILSSIRADTLLASSPKNALLSDHDGTMEPSSFYMLRYHRDRMLQAAEDLGWADTCDTIAGPSGLGLLRQVLHSYFVSESGRHGPPKPLKVNVSTHVCCIATDNPYSFVSPSTSLATSQSLRHHCRRFIHHHCSHCSFRPFLLPSAKPYLPRAGESPSILSQCLHRFSLVTRPPSAPSITRLDRLSRSDCLMRIALTVC